MRELEIAREVVKIAEFMTELGMSESEIDATIKRMFSHIANGGSLTPEAMTAVLHEYIPTVDELLEKEFGPNHRELGD